MYSVEWIPENDRHNCWNQHTLTNYRVVAWIHSLEVFFKHREIRQRIRWVGDK